MLRFANVDPTRRAGLFNPRAKRYLPSGLQRAPGHKTASRPRPAPNPALGGGMECEHR